MHRFLLPLLLATSQATSPASSDPPWPARWDGARLVLDLHPPGGPAVVAGVQTRAAPTLLDDQGCLPPHEPAPTLVGRVTCLSTMTGEEPPCAPQGQVLQYEVRGWPTGGAAGTLSPAERAAREGWLAHVANELERSRPAAAWADPKDEGEREVEVDSAAWWRTHLPASCPRLPTASEAAEQHPVQ